MIDKESVLNNKSYELPMSVLCRHLFPFMVSGVSFIRHTSTQRSNLANSNLPSFRRRSPAKLSLRPMKWNGGSGGSSGKGGPRNDLADDHRRGLFPSKSMPLLQFPGYHDPNTPTLSVPRIPTSSLHPSELFKGTSGHLGSSSSSTSYTSGLRFTGLPQSGSSKSSLPPLCRSGYLDFPAFSSCSSNTTSFGSENKYPNQFLKQEMSHLDARDTFRSLEACNADDLANSYMNFDGLEIETEEEDKKGKKTTKRKSNEGFKDDSYTNSVLSNHSRSLSIDSFLDKMKSSSTMVGISTPPANIRGVVPANVGFEFGNGEFSGGELKKIVANVRLLEIARTDPKRAKRILANRQSAARSKERKLKYISELELRVQTLQTEVTALTTRLTLSRRDNLGLANQNNELRFRLVAAEQQAQIRDSITTLSQLLHLLNLSDPLNEALDTEVQRLKLLTLDFSHVHSSNNLNQQIIDQYLHQVELQQHHQSSILTFQSRNQQEEEEEEEQRNGTRKQMNLVAPKDEYDSNFE